MVFNVQEAFPEDAPPVLPAASADSGGKILPVQERHLARVTKGKGTHKPLIPVLK